MAHASDEKSLAGNRPVPDSAAPAAGAPERSPVFGFLNQAFRGLINRRQQKWDREVAGIFAEIRSKAGEPAAEKILGNENFLTILTEASLIACRNHDDEKIEALRNAVLHAAHPEGPEEPVQLLFLRLIDYLTPLHLVTVVLLDAPEAWMTRHNVERPEWTVGTTSTVIQHCIPFLRGKTDLIEMIVRDLQGAGLVEQGYFLRMPMSGGGIFLPRTTDTGRTFVRFISAE